jgi:hypothetical protein
MRISTLPLLAVLCAGVNSHALAGKAVQCDVTRPATWTLPAIDPTNDLKRMIEKGGNSTGPRVVQSMGSISKITDASCAVIIYTNVGAFKYVFWYSEEPDGTTFFHATSDPQLVGEVPPDLTVTAATPYHVGARMLTSRYAKMVPWVPACGLRDAAWGKALQAKIVAEIPPGRPDLLAEAQSIMTKVHGNEIWEQPTKQDCDYNTIEAMYGDGVIAGTRSIWGDFDGQGITYNGPTVWGDERGWQIVLAHLPGHEGKMCMLGQQLSTSQANHVLGWIWDDMINLSIMFADSNFQAENDLNYTDQTIKGRSRLVISVDSAVLIDILNMRRVVETRSGKRAAVMEMRAIAWDRNNGGHDTGLETEKIFNLLRHGRKLKIETYGATYTDDLRGIGKAIDLFPDCIRERNKRNDEGVDKSERD